MSVRSGCVWPMVDTPVQANLIDFPPPRLLLSPWPHRDLFTWPLLIKPNRGHPFDKEHIDKDAVADILLRAQL